MESSGRVRALGVRTGLVLTLGGVFALSATAGGMQTQATPAPVRVVFETALGRIVMDVDVARAPISAQNFLKYVDGGFYDGGMANRAVRPDNTVRHDVPIQVVQFQINPERRREQFDPSPLERTSVTGLTHVDGAISMARNGPDTARASFSIMVGDQPSLDFGGARNADGQGFAVFGRVVEGADVVRAIHRSPTSASGRGAYRTETLDPPIRVIRAYREETGRAARPPR
jgi:peptidyl-prolyl cis-trans isomerase A (cyclophilin A)